MPTEQVPQINFKPEDLQEAYKTKPIVDWINKTGKHILVVVQALILIFIGVNFYFSRSLNSLTEEFNSLKGTTQSFEKLALVEEYKILQQKITEIENIQSKQIDWNARLSDLSEKVPSDLIIDEYEFNPNQLIISAHVESVQGFATFISKLRNDADIKTVVLTSSLYDQKTKIFEFKMEIELL